MMVGTSLASLKFQDGRKQVRTLKPEERVLELILLSFEMKANIKQLGMPSVEGMTFLQCFSMEFLCSVNLGS